MQYFYRGGRTGAIDYVPRNLTTAALVGFSGEVPHRVCGCTAARAGELMTVERVGSQRREEGGDAVLRAFCEVIVGLA